MQIPVRILIISPVAEGSTRGNQITALRYQEILQSLGHRVSIFNSGESTQPHELNAGDVDCIVTIHATRSYGFIGQVKKTSPATKIILVVSGTDLTRDLIGGATTDQAYRYAKQSLEMADKVILLQSETIHELSDQSLKELVIQKSCTIFQSAQEIDATSQTERNELEAFLKRHFPTWNSNSILVSVIGHLRYEKNPFLAVSALKHLPKSSSIHLISIGNALGAGYEQLANEHSTNEQNYAWIGGQSHRKTMLFLTQSHFTILSSRMEGGSSVVSEAIVNRVPILASKISSNVGQLGKDYTGFFGTEDAKQLAQRMHQCEIDASYRGQLLEHTEQVRPKFLHQHELKCWKDLLGELEL